MDTALIALTSALLIGVVATAGARRVALRARIVNAPNPIVPDHTTSVPYLGGIGIALGVYGGLIVASMLGTNGLATSPPVGIIVGSLLFLGIGLADDLLAFGATSKMILQVGSAVVALILGGLTPAISGLPLVDGLIAATYIVAVVNAVNFIDVSDGLAGTVAAVTSGLFAVALGGFPVAAIAVVGACIGFLVWNRPPARIFMGDAGSLFLGFMLAAFALTSTGEPATTSWWPYLPMLGLFLALPLFDLVFQASTRLLEGRPWWIGGPDSYALRLQKFGMSKAMVAWTSAVVVSIGWGAAWLLPRSPLIVQVVIVTAAVALAFAARTWLLRYRVDRREPVVVEAARTGPDARVGGQPLPAAKSSKGP